MKTAIAPPQACLEGRHRPSRSSCRNVGDVRRTICVKCGCELVRTQASRAWFGSIFLA